MGSKKEHEKHKGPLFRASEIVIIISGVLFLVSTHLIWSEGSFTLWFGTVLLYAVGTILFIMNR